MNKQKNEKQTKTQTKKIIKNKQKTNKQKTPKKQKQQTKSNKPTKKKLINENTYRTRNK